MNQQKNRCELCDKEFDSEEELDAHIRRIGLVE
ncbi:MAG: C2H2-type zinc finger protein [Halobacteriales archaeon]|nr:C2H2-type zinc finger protein [Halobacteriales archaeon]